MLNGLSFSRLVPVVMVGGVYCRDCGWEWKNRKHEGVEMIAAFICRARRTYL